MLFFFFNIGFKSASSLDHLVLAIHNLSCDFREDILIFLTGEEEIESVVKTLREVSRGIQGIRYATTIIYHKVVSLCSSSCLQCLQQSILSWYYVFWCKSVLLCVAGYPAHDYW